MPPKRKKRKKRKAKKSKEVSRLSILQDANKGEVKKKTLDPKLVERAKKIGFTAEQIKTYTDDESLRAACDRLKPQATPPDTSKPKKRPKYRIVADEPKGELTQIKTTTTISVVRAENLRRSDYDESLLWMFCRKNRINPKSVQKITFVRDYEPDKKGNMTTTITIDYFKKG